MDIEPDPDSTVTVDPSRRNMPWLDTGLELLVVDGQGRESVWPICRTLMQIGRHGAGSKTNDILLEGAEVVERQAMLQYRDGKVLFLNLSDACPATKGGKSVSFVEMTQQEEIALGSFRLRLVAHRDSLASLEGYSHPYMGRRWTLKDGPNPIGRPGKRENVVVLEDPTVSRTHATIERRDGLFALRPDIESVASFVNGQRIQGQRNLQDGDLVQLGQQILRFRLSKARTSSAGLAARPATILFADIWNYQVLSESRALDEFTRQVSEFYEMVDRVVEQYQGFLTTYLGDAVVAIFDEASGSEEHPLRAVRAGQAIQREVDTINNGWLASGLPPFGVGVGIHTGEVLLGDVSLRGKSEFAAVGEQARMSAHIEKLTKELDARILLSHTTATAVKAVFKSTSKGSFNLEGPDSVELFHLEY